MYLAAENYDLKTVYMLIQRGYDVNSSLGNKTPLEISIDKNKLDSAYN